MNGRKPTVPIGGPQAYTVRQAKLTGGADLKSLGKKAIPSTEVLLSGEGGKGWKNRIGKGREKH